MAIAAIMVLIAAARGDTRGSLAGVGYIVSFPALIAGPVGLVLGILALTRPVTMQTVDGRRHAIVGVATGVATLLLCCAIFVLVAIAGNARG
jgi:hypothetical protein